MYYMYILQYLFVCDWLTFGVSLFAELLLLLLLILILNPTVKF